MKKINVKQKNKLSEKLGLFLNIKFLKNYFWCLFKTK